MKWRGGRKKSEKFSRSFVGSNRDHLLIRQLCDLLGYIKPCSPQGNTVAAFLKTWLKNASFVMSDVRKQKGRAEITQPEAKQLLLPRV